MRLVFYETRFNRYSITALLASLEQNHVLDRLDIQIYKDKLQLSKEDDEPKIFCFSFFTPHLKQIEKEVQNLKRNNPHSIFIAGGPHPSGDPEGTLNLGFDYVFVGEGEEELPKFFENLNRNEKIIKGKNIDIDNYKAWSLKIRRFTPLEITRGCPYACKFCQTGYLFGTKQRHRSIDSILKHVEIFIKNGMKDLRFITPNALSYGSNDKGTPNLEAVETLLRSIKALSDKIRIYFGTFPSELRPDYINKESIEIIRRYASNNNITIGAQSGSPKVLERIGRGHSTEDIFNAVRTAINGGFNVNIDFIFGLPDETEREQIETVQFIERLIKLGDEKGRVVRINSHYFIPFVGTPFWNCKPAKLSKKLTNFLGRLYSSGKIFGHWHTQRQYTSF